MRAVVMGCGLASEDVLPARNGVGNRPKKPSLFFFFFYHIVHPPHAPQEFYPSGASGQGTGPS